MSLKWFDIKMKDGEIFELDENQHKILSKCLLGSRENRPDFISLPDGEIIATGYIAHIKLEKEDF